MKLGVESYTKADIFQALAYKGISRTNFVP